MSDFNKSIEVTSALATLQMLEEAVTKAAEGPGELRKRADSLYQSRVEQLARAHSVDMATAHGLATRDEVAKRAYALSQELADEHENAIEAGGRIAAYVG